MNTRSIDPATNEPLYTCYTCNLPVVPGNPGVYSKEHRTFCSPGCVYTFYEGEPAAQAEDYDL
jgi:hypothetical protein